MYKNKLIINPFEYKSENLDVVSSFAETLKDSFDTYIIVDEKPKEDLIEGVNYVTTDEKKRGYLEVTADYIIDAGAISGTSKLSTSQKRIAIGNSAVEKKYLSGKTPDVSISAIDYMARMDIAISPNEEYKEQFLQNCALYEGEIIDAPTTDAIIYAINERVGIDDGTRKYNEIIFLVNCLNKKDVLHDTIIKLAKTFKKAFNSKVYVMGLMEFDSSDKEIYRFDEEDTFDLKISTENNPSTCRTILTESDGIIIACESRAHYEYRDYIENKKVFTFAKDAKKKKEIIDINDRDFYKAQTWEKLFEGAEPEGYKGTVHIKKKDTSIIHRILKKQVDEIGTVTKEEVKKPRKNPDSLTEYPMVSIVIPFYNDNKTINNAVKSIRESGYDNYEIILVNDGSEEDPMDVLEDDNKIKFFYKENSGPGGARNMGVNHAEGKYLLYLDADDVSWPGGIEKMVIFAEANGLDMISGKTIRHYEDSGKEEAWYGNLYTREKINSKRERGLLIDDNLCHGKLYNLDFIRSKNIEFPDGLYEDADYMSKIYSSIEDIGIIPDCVQKWNVYGINTSRSTETNLNNVIDRMDVVDRINDSLEGPLKTYYTRQYIRHHLIASVNGFITLNDEEKHKLFEIMKEGIEKREDSIFEKLIVAPSKRELYKSIRNNDYDRFEKIASAFSKQYFTILSNV